MERNLHGETQLFDIVVNDFDAKNLLIYRPQRSWGKVMFSQASVSVILLTGGVCLSACWDTPPGADTPPSRHPLGSRHLPRSRHPQQTPPPLHSMLRDTVNAWTVRILLECNLVVTECTFYLTHSKRDPVQINWKF